MLLSPQPNYTCHSWVPDDRERVLIGTDNGEILLLEGGEFKLSLTPPGGLDAPAIECLIAHSKASHLRRAPPPVLRS